MSNASPIDAAAVRAYFEDERVVDHYRRATANIGLWKSEEILFTRQFACEDRILDLGCGTGRIAIGLAELGYTHVLGIEVSRAMVTEARRIALLLDLPVAFRAGDATRLPLDDALFDGAIFGFNGLMQIPGRPNRRRAMAEVRRVVRPQGTFVFTTHDRASPFYRDFWAAETKRWADGSRDPRLVEFGDRLTDTPLGLSFMHVPSRQEILEDLDATGWTWQADHLRSEIAAESSATREFSDECRFWIASRA